MVDLNLSWNRITNEGVVILGSALSGSSLKGLDLSFNYSISSEGWQTFINQVSLTSIESLALRRNNIGDAGLISLASVSTLKSLNVYSLNDNPHLGTAITPTGWQSFFNLLQTRGVQLVKLDISYNNIGNESVDVLRSFLSTSSNTLKTLCMSSMSRSFTPQNWQTLFTTLHDSNLDLVNLN